MSILEIKISRESWLESVKSKSDAINSVRAYQAGINQWDLFLKELDKDEFEILKEFKSKNQDADTYLFLNQYILWLTKLGVTRTTINLYFAALRSWCAANGVMLFNEYIKRFVKMPKQSREIKVPLTPDINRELVMRAPTKKMKAILLVLLSSGMRIGEVLQLRKMDINPKSDPIQINVRAGTTKTREQRIAYMSNEAWEMVRIILEDKNPEDYIFINEWTESTLPSFEIRFGRLRKDCGFLDKYDGGRNYHVNVHAFRAYFHTQATKVLGGDIAHAILGHRKYLDQYFRLEQKERSEMYKKLEPYISISNDAVLKARLDEKDRQLMEMENMKREIINLKAYQKREEDKRKKTN